MRNEMWIIPGYGVPDTEDGNQEEGILDTALETGPFEDAPLSLKDFLPEKIELRLGVKALGIKDKYREVGLNFDDRKCAPALLYDKQSLAYPLPFEHGRALHRGIHLVYGGHGESLLQGKTVPIQGRNGQNFTLNLKGNTLFKYNFGMPPLTREVVTVFGHDQTLSWPSRHVDATTLYPYGGYYVPGLPLEDIQQVYFYLVEDEGETRVALWRDSDCREKKIPPPEGGIHGRRRYLFHGTPDLSSLAGAILGGQITLNIQHHFGNFPFKSVAFQHPGGVTDQVHVEFRPA